VTRFSLLQSERVNGRAPRVRLNRFLKRSIRARVAKSLLTHQEHRTHTCGRFGGEVQSHVVAVDGPQRDALSGPVGLAMTVTNWAPMRANWVLTRCTRGSVPLADIAAARDRSRAAVATDEWQRAARATLLSEFPTEQLPLAKGVGVSYPLAPERQVRMRKKLPDFRRLDLASYPMGCEAVGLRGTPQWRAHFSQVASCSCDYY
jgi:hypothetical protein